MGAMWFFEHYPLSAKTLYGVGPRHDDVILMRDVEELIGKHFPDAPGEEDCTKSRPVGASRVRNYVEWLKERVGMAPGVPDQKLLGELKCKPEELEADLYLLMKEQRMVQTDEQAQKKLR